MNHYQQVPANNRPDGTEAEEPQEALAPVRPVIRRRAARQRDDLWEDGDGQIVPSPLPDEALSELPPAQYWD